MVYRERRDGGEREREQAGVWAAADAADAAAAAAAAAEAACQTINTFCRGSLAKIVITRL